MIKRNRTIDNMVPAANGNAKWLWRTMQDELCEGPVFQKARKDYHAMFKDDSNFLPNTAPYSPAE